MNYNEFQKYKKEVNRLIKKYVPNTQIEYLGVFLNGVYGRTWGYGENYKIELSLFALEQGSYSNCIIIMK